ncbi:hypothetical protein GJ744_006803 [Endocarpon pusillum]|uniref:Uncharacterized protein n=1 Tax=Endocarpon pusillum TaxID=364733 RepID=A0A8H7ANT4_9EURO|nr:hypothetical protein GJ744_006803 [Endocarpon pusillum]
MEAPNQQPVTIRASSIIPSPRTYQTLRATDLGEKIHYDADSLACSATIYSEEDTSVEHRQTEPNTDMKR